MSHKRVIEEYQIPYKSTNGDIIEFPYTPLNGVVFVWPKEPPTMQGSVYLVESVRDDFRSSRGVVLAVSRGVKNKKTKQWVECEVKPGDEILYDKSVPWHMMIKAPDGLEHKVVLMGMLDINALVNSEVENAGQSVQISAGKTNHSEEVKTR